MCSSTFLMEATSGRKIDLFVAVEQLCFILLDINLICNIISEIRYQVIIPNYTGYRKKYVQSLFARLYLVPESKLYGIQMLNI